MEIFQDPWSARGIGAFGTIVFVFIGAWGLLEQNRKIWKYRSGASVSIPMYIFFASFTATTWIYGHERGRIPLIVSGIVRGAAHIPILIGLWKFKSFTALDIALAFGLALATVAMAFLPYKDVAYFLFSLGCMVISVMQPIEIWQKKDAGVVDVKLIIIYFLSSIFWTMYGFARDDWAIKYISPEFLVIWIVTIVLWFKYRR